MFRCTVIDVKPKFMVVSLSLAPSRRFVLKNRVCCNTRALLHRSANSFTPRCPFESTTHRFPRLVVKASWYCSTFDLSYFNLGKQNLFQLYVVVQESCNWCSTVGVMACDQSLPHRTVMGVIYYHLEMCNSLPNCMWTNNIINNVMPPIC